MHAAMAMRAMQAGLHVYCEKPLTRTLHEARALRHYAEENGITTQMGNLLHEVKTANKKLATANEQIRQIARTDELTGLASRRYFLQRLKEEMAHAERHGHPLTLVSLDVDDFKAVNDQFGHAAGDAVLRKVGEVLLELCRTSDIPSRQGGEELSIVLPDTDIQSGLLFAERVRLHIRQNSALDGERVVTASIGVAEYEPAENLDSFLRRVDEAMYTAKKDGKDKVCAYNDVSELYVV